VPEYVTGATRAAAVAGICWAFLSLFPIAGALVREPAQNVTFVAQGAVTVLTSAVLARRRILRRRLSKLYLLWVLASLALVVGGLVAARTAAPASWFLPGYAAVWTVSYVVMTELRRRDLRSLLGNFPHY